MFRDFILQPCEASNSVHTVTAGLSLKGRLHLPTHPFILLVSSGERAGSGAALWTNSLTTQEAGGTKGQGCHPGGRVGLQFDFLIMVISLNHKEVRTETAHWLENYAAMPPRKPRALANTVL